MNTCRIKIVAGRDRPLTIEEAAKLAAFRKVKVTVVPFNDSGPWYGLSAYVTVAKDNDGRLRAFVHGGNRSLWNAEDAAIIARVARTAARLAADADELLISHNLAAAK